MARAIDWDDLLLFWNEVFHTEYTLHKQMLNAAYKTFPSLKELSIKLDVSPEALRQKMRREGILLKKPGHSI